MCVMMAVLEIIILISLNHRIVEVIQTNPVCVFKENKERILKINNNVDGREVNIIAHKGSASFKKKENPNFFSDTKQGVTKVVFQSHICDAI